MDERHTVFLGIRSQVLLLALPLLLGSGGAVTPGESFVRHVLRSLGGVETTCYRKIQLLEQSMREKDSAMNFRTSCGKLPRESSNLDRVKEAVGTVAERMEPESSSALLLEDWTRHETFGTSFSVKYRIADETVIVWWHPATRLLEFRIWNGPAGDDS
jgi:hypothetical protein